MGQCITIRLGKSFHQGERASALGRMDGGRASYHVPCRRTCVCCGAVVAECESRGQTPRSRAAGTRTEGDTALQESCGRIYV